MKTIIVKLDDAIVVDGKETSELSIRKPNVKDLKHANAAGKLELDRSLALIGNLAGLSPTDLDNLSLTDLGKINEEMVKENFIPAAPKLQNS